jgi:hypothetical protein
MVSPAIKLEPAIVTAPFAGLSGPVSMAKEVKLKFNMFIAAAA